LPDKPSLQAIKITMRNLKKYIFTLFTSLAIISGLFFSFTSNRQRTGNKEDEKRILIVSDIHFNPFSGTSLNDTALKSKLIRSSFDEWKRLFDSIPAQKTITANLLGQDANYAVLKAALDNMKMKLPHPSFIVIAGDFIWQGKAFSLSLHYLKKGFRTRRLFRRWAIMILTAKIMPCRILSF
jgi:predicted MPP superfamily phosphohydrolase